MCCVAIAEPKTPSKAHFSLLVPMERDCSNSNDIIHGVEIKLSVLPCTQSANCSTRVSTQCEQPQPPSSAVSRKNGSTSESLAVIFDMTLDFGDSVVLDSSKCFSSVFFCGGGWDDGGGGGDAVINEC